MAGARQTWNLATLDTIYRFATQKRSPSDVELAGPLQVVHDVAPAASDTAVAYISGQFTVVTGGAGAQTFDEQTEADVRSYSSDVEELLKNAGLTRANSQMWLMSYNATINAPGTNLDRVVAAVAAPGRLRNVHALVTTPARLIWFSDTVSGGNITSSGAPFPIQISTGGAGAGPFAAGNRAFAEVTLPVRLSALRVLTQDDGGGAVSVVHSPIYAIAPLGLTPAPI